MSPSDIPWSQAIDVVFVIALIVLILGRQLGWRSVDRMLRISLILLVLGALLLGQQIGLSLLGVRVLAVLVLTVAVGGLGGLAMGLVSSVRTGADGAVLMRGGWRGLALWVGYLAVRLVLVLGLDRMIAPELAGAGGLILVSVGLARLVSALVARQRALGGGAIRSLRAPANGQERGRTVVSRP